MDIAAGRLRRSMDRRVIHRHSCALRCRVVLPSRPDGLRHVCRTVVRNTRRLARAFLFRVRSSADYCICVFCRSCFAGARCLDCLRCWRSIRAFDGSCGIRLGRVRRGRHRWLGRGVIAHGTEGTFSRGLVVVHHKTPNQTLERTAARRVFTFQMIETVSLEPTLATSVGRSALSR